MVFPGHLAGGYLATKLLLNVAGNNLPATDSFWLLILGTVSGYLPDIDIWIMFVDRYFTKNKVTESHRNYITHAPLFWLLISLPIVIIGRVSNSELVEFVGLAVLCGTWSHFILDSFEYGVRWLWPFTSRRFSVIKTPHRSTTSKHPSGTIPYYWEFITKHYWKSPVLYIEIVVSLIALYLLLFK